MAGEHDRFKIGYGHVCARRTDVCTAIGAEHHCVHISACGSLQVTLWLSGKKLEGPFYDREHDQAVNCNVRSDHTLG